MMSCNCIILHCSTKSIVHRDVRHSMVINDHCQMCSMTGNNHGSQRWPCCIALVKCVFLTSYERILALDAYFLPKTIVAGNFDHVVCLQNELSSEQKDVEFSTFSHPFHFDFCTRTTNVIREQV